MIRVVLDTNVLVSAVRADRGPLAVIREGRGSLTMRIAIRTENPTFTRPRRRYNRLESRTISPLPRRTVYRVSPTEPHPQALGDAVVDREPENKTTKPAIACGERV